MADKSTKISCKQNVSKWLIFLLIGLLILGIIAIKAVSTTKQNTQDDSVTVVTPTPEPQNDVSPTPPMVKKPVIYVYNYSGQMQISINTKFKPVNLEPEFNIPNGWQFIVHSNKIILNNETYPYLFYELELTPCALKLSYADIKPIAYLKVNTHLLDQLIDIFMQIGMTKDEAVGMAEYWAKDLQKIDSSYIRVAMLNKQRINDLSVLNINPKPEYVARIIFVFTPVNNKDNQLNSLPALNPAKFTIINKKMRKKYIVIEYGGFVYDF